MKKKIILTMLLSLPLSLLAQNNKKKEVFQPKVFLKTNLLTYLFQTTQVGLEFKTKPHRSTQISVQVIDNRSVFKFNKRHSSNEYITGVGGIIEWHRFSRKNPALQGFYYGPYFKFQSLRSSIYDSSVQEYLKQDRINTSLGYNGGLQIVNRYGIPSIGINLGAGLVYTHRHQTDEFLPEVSIEFNFGFGY